MTRKSQERHYDVEKVKYSGWATSAVVDYPWQQFNFGIIGAYGSGADTNKTSASGLAGTNTADGVESSKVGSFVVPPSTEAAAAFGESLVLFSWWGTRGDSGIGNSLNYNQVSKGGLGGLWYAKLYAVTKPHPGIRSPCRDYISVTPQRMETPLALPGTRLGFSEMTKALVGRQIWSKKLKSTRTLNWPLAPVTSGQEMLWIFGMV